MSEHVLIFTDGMSSTRSLCSHSPSNILAGTWWIHRTSTSAKSRNNVIVNFDFTTEFDPEVNKMCAACHMILVVAKLNNIAWTDLQLEKKVEKLLKKAEAK